jgi:hypothetical protein
MKKIHRHRVQKRLIQRKHSKEKRQRLDQQDEIRHRQEQRPHVISELKPCYRYEGSKQKRWQALFRWESASFPFRPRIPFIEGSAGSSTFRTVQFYRFFGIIIRIQKIHVLKNLRVVVVMSDEQ